MNLEYVGAFTRQPFEVAFEHEHAGKVATYFAKWVTSRGLEGAWSAGVSMMIAFAGPAPGSPAPGTPAGKSASDAQVVGWDVAA